MKSLLSKNHFNVVNGDKILAISQKARKARNKSLDIIDGTIGMLYDDESHLAQFKLVDEIISNSIDEDTKKYGSVNGGIDFENNIKKWLFEKNDLSQIFCKVIATIGATGALTLSMRNYAEIEQEILVPSIRWSSYDNIASQLHLKIKEYNMFNSDDSLDVESIKMMVDYSINKYQRVFLLINDPCQNPTGYTMRISEWMEVLSYLKEKAKKYPIVLLLDIAYLNYSDYDYSKVFELMIKYLCDNFIINVTFSASKTLSIYGLRGGALIGLTKNQKDIQDFYLSCQDTARSIWSMPNNVAIKVINQCFESEEKRIQIYKIIENYRNLINKRAKIFFEESEMVGLVSYNYVNGFFVLTPCKNPDEVCEKLISKNIFLVPMADGIRISLASITTKQIKGLAKEIKKAIKN